MSQDEMNRIAFKEEALDLLAELESALLELEENPENRDLVDRVFRAMHTIKGSGAMFGFDDIAGFTHEVETAFDMVRNGQAEISKELLDLTLAARDRINDMLVGSDGVDRDPELSRSIVSGLQQYMARFQTEEEDESLAPEALKDEPGVDEGSVSIYRIRFKPAKNIFLSGASPLPLLDELCELGTARVIAHFSDIPLLAEYDPEACYGSWDIILHTSAGESAIRDVFIFVEDDCSINIKRIASEEDLEDEIQSKKLGEILVERGDVDPQALEKALSGQKRIGDILAESGLVTKTQLASALAEQSAIRSVSGTRKPQEVASSLRVAADKLDTLVDLVGELVIVQARISQVVGEKGDPILTTLAEELERLSDELRDSTLGIRMLPIGTTFSKFRRLVRDLSDELGKEIDLETEGAETELDKTVIEQLGDPLVHLLRNSIDHGIESPEQRKAEGKDPSGIIRLSAEHSGGEVLIRIMDDGKGMDPEVIRAKAVEKNIISPDADLTDKEIFALIFQPGFSTAAAVTSVSGRGVGMDVVKRAIDSLRGSIDIDSVRGKGTTITVKMPLTLAIIDGLQIKVGEEYYVIPLSLVEECIELKRSDFNGTREQRIVNLREEIVPYIRIREWFDVAGTAPPIEQIVITSVGQSRIGIVVDHVIGEHQTVIKTLGRVYRDVDGISGATIKGDGSMALILDVPRLVQSVSARD